MQAAELIKFLGMCAQANHTLQGVYTYLDEAQDAEDDEVWTNCTAEQRWEDYKMYLENNDYDA